MTERVGLVALPLRGKKKASPALLRIIALATISGFLFGVDTSAISGALPALRRDFKLSPTESELIVGATMLG